MAIPTLVERAGRWFIASGIQESDGGVARYYRSDAGRNNPVSTEITGYAVSTLVYLHALTGDECYLDRAGHAARFLARVPWQADAMPFEPGSNLAYFFDSGIIARGLLAAWRATGEEEFLDAAVRCGRSMLQHFRAEADFHPVVELPQKLPATRDRRWSRSSGCYQLKSALAWSDLFEATGDAAFQEPYCRVLEYSLRTYESFLPGDPDRHTVMDRLHAFSYFLEGMLPRTDDARCAEAIRKGMARVALYVRDIAPEFERADVYAQLLRMRVFADSLGVEPLDADAAAYEAERLESFACKAENPRIDGGFWFGRKGGKVLPYVNPVSAGFGLQALAMWRQHLEGEPRTYRHMLI